jgi:hypothetical protein
MTNLPNELLVNIFEYLTYADIASCKNVCRHWRNIIISHIAVPKTFIELVIDHHKYEPSFDFDRYIRLHKQITNISEFNITDHLNNSRLIAHSIKESVDYSRDGAWVTYNIYRLYQYYDLYIIYDINKECSNWDILDIPREIDNSSEYSQYSDMTDDSICVKKLKYCIYEEWLNDSTEIYKINDCTHEHLLKHTNDLKFILDYFKNVSTPDEMIKYMLMRTIG